MYKSGLFVCVFEIITGEIIQDPKPPLMTFETGNIKILHVNIELKLYYPFVYILKFTSL